MRTTILTATLLLAGLLAAQAPAQPPASQALSSSQSTQNLVREVTNLFARTYSTRADLQRQADRIARSYTKLLKKIKTEVTSLVAAEVDDLGLQQKLNLALELWRVRASLDLLALTNPETLKELTGLTLPDLSQLQKRLLAVKIW